MDSPEMTKAVGTSRRPSEDTKETTQSNNNTKSAALNYIQHGWVIVPIPQGLKGPKGEAAIGWNLPENCITSPDHAARLNGGNIGLAHAYSRTCAIDFDDLTEARVWFSEQGIDAGALLNSPDSVRIASNRPNRDKLLFKVPADIDPLTLHTKKVANGALEFRCASEQGTTVQDVLPPSIHPDTKRPYRWVYGDDLIGDWRYLPELPTELLTLWRKQINAKPAAYGATGKALAGVDEGGRNDALFKYAAKMRGDGISFEDAKPLIFDAAAKCNPPLSRREALTTLKSAYRYQPNILNTQQGNAERLVARHGEDLRFCANKWLYWDYALWCWDEDGEIYRRAKDAVKAIFAEAAVEQDDARRTALAKWGAVSQSSTGIKAMVFLAQSESGIPLAPCSLDQDIMLLGVANGTLDLRTAMLSEPRRSDYITKRAHVTFDSTATCPQWLAFLDRIMAGRAELVDYLQRVVGYILTGSTSAQCFFLFYGVGANGKSTFLNVLRAMLGDYATHTATETLMVSKRVGGNASPDLARLRGARLVSAAETEDGERLAESQIKSITGGDVIAARALYQDIIEFTPQFKLILLANHRPIVTGTDHAMWRRIHLIPFDSVIPPEEQDPHLTSKLVNELPGILNWAIEGCRTWQHDGLRPPASVLSAVAEYRQDMDTIGQFFADCCEIGEGLTVAAGELYRSYVTWASENTHWHISQTKFARKLVERGFQKTRTGAQRSYAGIRLLRVDESDFEDDPGLV